MIIYPGGERLKWKFWRGGGSILGADFGKSRGGRGHRKNPFGGGGGLDIFWNYTMLKNSKKISVSLRECDLVLGAGTNYCPPQQFLPCAMTPMSFYSGCSLCQ